MGEKLLFRKLKADEIDCRISTVSEKGVSLLLYKDARVDQNILDEAVGAMNWQRIHTRDNANCIVSIWDAEKSQWVGKEDTGTESNTEKEKGLASDSFKRACFNWGIGRELYTAPFVWVNVGSGCTLKDIGIDNKTNKKKYTCFDKFAVSDIGYDNNGNINSLVIKNVKTKQVVYKLGENSQEPEPSNEKTYVTEAQINTLLAECKRTGVGRNQICRNYSVGGFEAMTIENFVDAMEVLKNKPDKPIDQATVPPDEPEAGLPFN